MAARFQVLSVPVPRCARVPVPGGSDAVAGSRAKIPHPLERGFTWRFMSANNRSIAKSVHTSADVEACLATIRTLQESLHLAVGETVRNRQRQWVWSVRLDGEIVATASRSYPRQVRARITCNAFLQLVAQTSGSAPGRVRSR